MPREVVDALKKSGHWQEGSGIPAAVRTNEAPAAPSQSWGPRALG